MLLPRAAPAVDSGDFLSVAVPLPAATKTPVPGDCAIQGDVFSLRPVSGSDRRTWTLRGPSAAGWQSLGGQVDIDAQWMLFTRALVRLAANGCFPSGLTAQSVRSALAAALPLPASEVPIFMYSDQGERFVNLVPGMEMRLQQFQPAAASPHAGSPAAPRLLTAVYEIVARHQGGAALRRNRSPDAWEKALLAAGDRQSLTLAQRFAHASVLRLILQGFSQGEAELGAILLGASDPAQLDQLSDRIRRQGAAACVTTAQSLCIALPSGSVSLFSILELNGRPTASPFGTSLASLLFLLPPPRQAAALQSVQVFRPLAPGRYAGIQITRTLEGARQLLLLPGDRIQWSD
jgi:hypothetical protein